MFAKIFGPKIVGWFVYRYILLEQIDINKKHHFILCSRNIFSKDIIEMKKNITDFNFIILSNSILGAVQSAWLPKYAREQSFYYDLLPKEAKNWKNCELFSQTLILHLEKTIKLNGIISANFDYWQDAGFREICKDSNIHFIVLRRENELTKEDIKNDVYKRFSGINIGYIHLVMVFSNICKEALHKIESEKLIFRNIIVTGPPRMDYIKGYFTSENREIEKKKIVIFTYFNGNYGDGKKNFWEVIEKVNKYVLDNELSLCLKCKSTEDLFLIKKEISNRITDKSRIEFLLKISTAEAVKDAFCVIGYGSTVLGELLAMPIDIIIPFVYASEKEKNDQILHEANTYPNSGVHRVDSFNELGEKLDYLLKNKTRYSFEQRDILRERYLSWNPEELSSKRVENALYEYCINN